jgi:hypothetical protein
MTRSFTAKIRVDSDRGCHDLSALQNSTNSNPARTLRARESSSTEVMKRLIILVALLLIGSISTPAAQEVPEQARQRLEQIKERLKLTPEQIEQVRPIFADEIQKLKALRETHSGGAGGSRRDRLKMGRELKRIQGEADDRLKKVLSKEQMQELKKIREESREKLRERRSNGRAGMLD